MTTWINGNLVADHEAVVSVYDHGLTVGDGVFETLKVIEGQPFALTRHLRRLGRSAAGLGLVQPDESFVREGVRAVLAASAGEGLLDGRLRITLTSGHGPLGSQRSHNMPTLMVAVAAAGECPASLCVVTAPWVRNERGATAGLKTTSYAENVVALHHAVALVAQEALLANGRDELCEGTGSNVFVVLDGQAFTPPLSSGCLAGVTRELVLEWCDAQERVLPHSVLQTAEEIFLTSSTRDVVGVSEMDGRRLSAPGPVTAAVARQFAARAALDIDP